MKSKMKLAFLGLSDYGLRYFKCLINNENFDIVFATTKSKESTHADSLYEEYKKICIDKNIKLFEHTNINNDDDIKHHLKDTDVALIGGYDLILKKDIINLPKLGVINTHFGLIPMNRGTNPSMWSILNDRVGGYTTYLVNEKIDYGEIIEQKVVDVEDNETSYSLYMKLCELAELNFPELLGKIHNWKWEKVLPFSNLNNYHKAGMPNDRWISWGWKSKHIYRFHNALTFPPYPTCRTKIHACDKDFEIYITDYNEHMHHEAEGKIVKIKDNNYKVYCEDGYVTAIIKDNEILSYLDKENSLESILIK